MEGESIMPIKPWWVITILPDEGHLSNQSVGDQLDKQLLRWSVINGIMPSDDSPRWWTIDCFSPPIPADETEFVQQIDQFLYNPLQRKNGQEPRIGGDIDATQLGVAIIGDVRDDATLAYLHCLGKMLKIKQPMLFEGMSLRNLSLIYFPQSARSQTDPESNRRISKFLTELHTMIEHETIAHRPFEFVFLLQDRNNTVGNTEGYTALDERQASELIVQSLFHLMIGESDELENLKNVHQTSYFSIGAAAIYYDWQKHRRKLARELGEDLLYKFKSSNEEPFVSEEQARRAVINIEHETEIRRLFSRLTLGKDRPSFSFSSKIWEGAKERGGKLISPWALHRKELLYFYFLLFLRRLPFRLSEYARLFLTSSLQQFRDFLRSRRSNVWEGNPEHKEKGLKDVILETLRNVLKGEFGTARSIEQVKKVMEQVKKVCDAEKVTSSLAQIDEFRELKVFEVPDYLEEFYNRASDYLSADEEARLYDRLVETIHIHPMPLALFLRASLLALLSAFLGSNILSILSPQIINLEWLLRIPGLVLIVLGIIPLGCAFWRYQARTLNEIQKQLKMYVAAVLRHAQTKAKEMVKGEIVALFNQARCYCDEIKEKYLNELKDKFNYPFVESESYLSTAFQRFILEEIEIPGRGKSLRILEKEPGYEIEVSGQKKPFNTFDGQEKNSLLNAVLNRQVKDVPKYLWELLCDKLPEGVSEESVKKAGELLREFSEEMYKQIERSALHGLLLSPGAKEHIMGVIEQMKSLSFPPVVLSSGALGIEVSFEWKYGQCGSISAIVDKHTCSGIPGASILSLSGYRPIRSLRDIATIHAMSAAIELDQIAWQDASAIFTMATLGDEGDLVLKSAFDDAPIQITDKETKERVKKLRQALGIEKGEGEPQLEI
jgi:hypothetical protein